MNRLLLFSVLLLGAFCSACSSPTEPAHTRILSGPTQVTAPEVRVSTCFDTTITLVNRGTDSLHITAALSDVSALTVTGAPVAIAAGASTNITLQFCPQSVAAANAQVTLTTDGTDSTHFAIRFSATGSAYAPGTGSLFTYDAVTIDSLGRFVNGSQHQLTEYVAGTGLSYMGRINVTHVSGAGSEVYYQIPSDGGDVAYFAKGFPTGDTAGSFGGGWWTLPTQSHQTVHIFAGDTTFQTPKLTIALHGEITAAYKGDTTFSISGKPLTASHIQILEQATYTPQIGGPIPYDVAIELFYSPEIGYMVVQAAYARSQILPRSGGELRLLHSFVLQ